MPEPPPEHLDLRVATLPLTYTGRLQEYTHPVVKGALWRFLHHKRWMYLWVDGMTWILGLAVIDLGYMAKIFVFLAEEGRATPALYQETLFLPGRTPLLYPSPTGKLSVRAKSRSLQVMIQYLAEQDLFFSVIGSCLEIRGQGGPPLFEPLIAANQLPRGGINLTRKSMAHNGLVEIRYGKQHWQAQKARIHTDLTDGFLPHVTRWYWANLSGISTQSGAFGLNLVQGFNGACECILWHEQAVIPLGEAQFQGQTPDQEWRIQTTCNRVQLQFHPWTALWDKTRLGLLQSDFRQLYGTFSGHIQLQGQTLLLEKSRGVAEYQDVCW